jgi:hypothetical protein
MNNLIINKNKILKSILRIDYNINKIKPTKKEREKK